ncbi:hypothetical protein LIER_38186 [Lithospermum erythrorhizon]|uniref:Uncharacterized protein n=1 Tax=Lithospermum erythrorhizon TaxID=34254 RepID=A0AAV3Q0F4_LITER
MWMLLWKRFESSLLPDRKALHKEKVKHLRALAIEEDYLSQLSGKENGLRTRQILKHQEWNSLMKRLLLADMEDVGMKGLIHLEKSGLPQTRHGARIWGKKGKETSKVSKNGENGKNFDSQDVEASRGVIFEDGLDLNNGNAENFQGTNQTDK